MKRLISWQFTFSQYWICWIKPSRRLQALIILHDTGQIVLWISCFSCYNFPTVWVGLESWAAWGQEITRIIKWNRFRIYCACPGAEWCLWTWQCFLYVETRITVVLMRVGNDAAHYESTQCSKSLESSIPFPKLGNSHRKHRTRNILNLVIPRLLLWWYLPPHCISLYYRNISYVALEW
jgi:hypothetical protein